MVGGWWVVGGLFDFRVTPNPNFMLDVNLDVEFDNNYWIDTKVQFPYKSDNLPVLKLLHKY